VFSCALANAANPTGFDAERQSAVQFLLETRTCQFWATVANVNAEAIRKHAWTTVLVGNHPDVHTTFTVVCLVKSPNLLAQLMFPAARD
jgi:hypothetical protein